MIFQQYALFPWKTVQENVEFGLKMKRIPKSERKAIAAKFIDLVALNGFEKSYPHKCRSDWLSYPQKLMSRGFDSHFGKKTC